MTVSLKNALISFLLSMWIRLDAQRWNCDRTQMRMEKEPHI